MCDLWVEKIARKIRRTETWEKEIGRFGRGGAYAYSDSRG